MSRDALLAVTMPILVKAEEHDRIDGWGNVFPSRSRTELTGLKVVTPSDVASQLEKWKRTQPKVRLLCGSLRAMADAYQLPWDRMAFRNALVISWEFVPRLFGTTPRPSHLKREGAAWIYASLMSRLLQDSRFLFWYRNQHGQPLQHGLYCPTWETAAFAFMGTGRIRICRNPKCGKVFIPNKETQDYCRPAHGDAHRQARWRSRRARQRKAGRKNN